MQEALKKGIKVILSKRKDEIFIYQADLIKDEIG
jgi:hypothetical protein